MNRVWTVVLVISCTALLAMGDPGMKKMTLEADGKVYELGEKAYELGEVVYEETFQDMDSLWIEGNKDNVRLEEGCLVMNANVDRPDHALTVFVDNIFKGDLYFEYDATVLASEINGKEANNINTFLYYSDPSGKNLKKTMDKRMDAAYSHYHDLNGYIVTFLNATRYDAHEELPENTARIRMRENPGFTLMQEELKYNCKIGRTYKLQFLYADGTLFFFVDGNFMASFEPSENRVYNEGYFAFRTFATKLSICNFTVRTIR